MLRRLVPLALVVSGMCAPNAAAQPHDPDLGRNLAASCAGCHGTDGRSIGGMQALAGRPRADIERAMKDFRDGKRPATIMHQLARGYSDAQIEAVSAYLSARR
ncbi:MAG: c-type cytochrome [Burkholderiales bacterium]|nr:c-type cytochrome [Burkholderiales bacterium]